jgi:ABC-type transporter Mla subunit MlaD
MGLLDIVLAPARIARAVVRAAEDLNALAERARRDPDPIDEVRALLDTVLADIRSLDRHAVAVDHTAQTIVTGGDDLRRTGESLDAHTVELISGGRELTEVAKDLAGHLAAFRAVLPRLLETLDTVEDLEDSLETVADTVEPLQGVANGVGRMTRRLSS